MRTVKRVHRLWCVCGGKSTPEGVRGGKIEKKGVLATAATGSETNSLDKFRVYAKFSRQVQEGWHAAYYIHTELDYG